MGKRLISIAGLLFVLSCSPRDFLTRRLATDLIAGSSVFRSLQRFQLQIGVMSNKDYAAPEYLIMQHHGWISASVTPCRPGLAPAPCWDVLLTPSGVDTIRSIVSSEEANKSSFEFAVANRELVGVTGINKDGSLADVDFVWRWVPLNEVGAALYSGDLRYTSTVGFRHYDDGWRVLQRTPHPSQTIDEALKNAEPLP
jgi:hypothetical protein